MKSASKARHFCLRSIVPVVLSLSSPIAAIASPPTVAAQQGYNVETFASVFNTSTVDMNDTHNRGFKWYVLDLFGRKADPTTLHLNSDSSVTLLGTTNGAVGTLSSVIAYPGTDTFVGTAFGGGAYIEAVFSYDPATVTAAHAGGKRAAYPSLWSLPMEGNLIPGANQWIGQPAGYQHNVEVDMFEADYVNKPVSYGVGLHDWYGIPNKTCAVGLCGVGMTNPSGEREPPAGTNFKQFHTYGFLWVPATATTEGFMNAYFDGKMVGHTRAWTEFTNQSPTPVGQTWAFGHIDQEHLFFILGTGPGEPYTVKSVNVWQKNTQANMSN